MVLQHDRHLRQQPCEAPCIAGKFQPVYMDHRNVELLQQISQPPRTYGAAAFARVEKVIRHTLPCQLLGVRRHLQHRYLGAGAGDCFGNVGQRWPLREYLRRVPAAWRGQQIEMGHVHRQSPERRERAERAM